MTSLQPTVEQIEAFETMFGFFNRALFDSRLPSVGFYLSRHARTPGFFRPARWARSGSKAHVIALNPSAHADARALAAHLVFLMCQLWQHVAGQPGCGSYCNRELIDAMAEVGLLAVHPGTRLPTRSAHRVGFAVAERGRFAAAFARMPSRGMLPWRLTAATDRGRRKTRWQCPKCAAKMWGSANLEPHGCLACKVPWVRT